VIIEDVQNRSDSRGISIDRVGIRDLRYPITVLDREEGKRETVANFSMSVELPHHFKGTHMSRFVEVLNDHRGEVTMRTLPDVLGDLRRRLEAEKAQLVVEFPYFLERVAPASGAKAFVDYECKFKGESTGDGFDFVLGVRVPVTSLCPCSKEISDYGAHNQRGELEIEVRTCIDDDEALQFVWIEELVDLAEGCASSPVYSLLKREDERHVTMKAFENPVFVEDMVRNVALRLKEDGRVAWFRVHALNHESIHNHNAFAEIEWAR